MIQDTNQTITQIAAMVDGINYLSAMVNAGFASAHFEDDAVFYFTIKKAGVSALVSIAFDDDKKPIIATAALDRLRWFTYLKWECLLVYSDKLIFQGPLIKSDTRHIQCFSIQLPVSENVAKILVKQSSISIGYDAEMVDQVVKCYDCTVHNLMGVLSS